MGSSRWTDLKRVRLPVLLRATPRRDPARWSLRSEVNLTATEHSRDTPNRIPDATNHRSGVTHIVIQGNLRYSAVRSCRGLSHEVSGADAPICADRVETERCRSVRRSVSPIGTEVMGAVALGCRVLMSRSGRSEPGRKRSRQLWVREVSRPGDMSVGSDQHCRGSSDLAMDRELPHASMLGVDQPDSIRPRSDVETAGFTEVEEHGPGVV